MKSEEVISLEDKAKISFLELQIQRKHEYELTLKDVIISLFGVHADIPIETRTLLYKELFLTFEEILNEDDLTKLRKNIDPKFIPYVYGPFSFVVASEIGKMLDNHILNKEGYKRDERFTLTDFGKNLFVYLSRRLEGNYLFEKFIEKLRKLRVGWDKLGAQGIMTRVKKIYPQYFLFGVKGYKKTKKLVLEMIEEKNANPKSVLEIADSIINIDEVQSLKDKYLQIEKENSDLIWATLLKE